MDELDVVLAARRLIKAVNTTEVPVLVEKYVDSVGASLCYESTLEASQAGYTVTVKGKPCIVVNGTDSAERKRFTVCHELGHIVLRLPTEHDQTGYSFSYAKRSKNEIFCDVFAAELLLPSSVFKPLANEITINFLAIDELAAKFKASRTATGSRFAAVNARPCAFVLSERGIVRYASRSPSLRDANAWIEIGIKVPACSLAAKANGIHEEGPNRIPADEWFDGWRRAGNLLEDARYLPPWDQTLSLLWFEEEEIPESEGDASDAESELGLKEIDGILPWPGKSKRRR